MYICMELWIAKGCYSVQQLLVRPIVIIDSSIEINVFASNLLQVKNCSTGTENSGTTVEGSVCCS